MACNILPEGGVAMNRSFESVRMWAKEISARRLKARRALKKEDKVYGLFSRLGERSGPHLGESSLKISLCQTIPIMPSVSLVPPQLPTLNDLLRISSFHQAGQMGSG